MANRMADMNIFDRYLACKAMLVDLHKQVCEAMDLNNFDTNIQLSTSASPPMLQNNEMRRFKPAPLINDKKRTFDKPYGSPSVKNLVLKSLNEGPKRAREISIAINRRTDCVATSLTVLYKEEKIVRIAKGLYCLPEHAKSIGSK